MSVISLLVLTQISNVHLNVKYESPGLPFVDIRYTIKSNFPCQLIYQCSTNVYSMFLIFLCSINYAFRIDRQINELLRVIIREGNKTRCSLTRHQFHLQHRRYFINWQIQICVAWNCFYMIPGTLPCINLFLFFAQFLRQKHNISGQKGIVVSMVSWFV